MKTANDWAVQLYIDRDDPKSLFRALREGEPGMYQQQTVERFSEWVAAIQRDAIEAALAVTSSIIDEPVRRDGKAAKEFRIQSAIRALIKWD